MLHQLTYFNLFGPSDNISFYTTYNIPLVMLKYKIDQGKRKEQKRQKLMQHNNLATLPARVEI